MILKKRNFTTFKEVLALSLSRKKLKNCLKKACAQTCETWGRACNDSRGILCAKSDAVRTVVPNAKYHSSRQSGFRKEYSEFASYKHIYYLVNHRRGRGAFSI